jgi:hypothetical protein
VGVLIHPLHVHHPQHGLCQRLAASNPRPNCNSFMVSETT